MMSFMNQHGFSKPLTMMLAALLICASVALPQAPFTPPASDAQANQQKARAILDKMIQALGGPAYLTLQDSESEGRAIHFYHGTPDGISVYHRYWQWPGRERVEYTKQRDVVRLTIGDEMYEITLRGSRLVDPKKDYDAAIHLQRRNHSLENVLRQWLTEPGTALFDEGRGLAENHSIERVTVMNSKNDAVTVSIDSNTHLPVKMSFVIRDPQGSRDEIAEIYDNWKTVQGVNTAYNTLVTRNGELVRQCYLAKVSYNHGIADSVFAAPAPGRASTPVPP